MWPTEYSVIFIILGFIPILYVLYKTYKFGVIELVNLRSAFIILNWFGYHFIPMVAIFSKNPEEFLINHTVMPGLLSFDYIDNSLIFSFFSMIFFIIGYSRVIKNHKYVDYKMNLNIKISYFIILFIFYLILSLHKGLDEFLFSSKLRGEGQEYIGTTERVINILKRIIGLIVITLSSLFILEKQKKAYVFLGWLALIFSISVYASEFSRMAGFPLFVFSFLMLKFYRGKIWKAFLLILIGLYLGKVSLEERNQFNPGIGNYIHALYVNINSQENKHTDLKNPISATEPFTVKAEMKDDINPDFFTNIKDFFIYINPIPSFIIYQDNVGIDIKEYLGIGGEIEITSPALADLYYLFSFSGSIFFFFLGILYAYIEKYNMDNPNSNMAKISVLLSIYSIGEGIHKNIRAHTRGLFYALILIFMEKIWRNKK